MYSRNALETSVAELSNPLTIQFLIQIYVLNYNKNKKLLYLLYMKRNFTQNKLEQEAMEDLRNISESPWFQNKNLKVNQASIKIQKYVNTRINYPRPTTQSQKRHNFFETSPVYKPNKTSHDLPININYRIRMPYQAPKSQEFKLGSCGNESYPLTNKIRTRSQMRDMKTHKSQNYSELRKTFQTGFFIGRKINDQSINKKEQKIINGGKSIRRGRLWLGRPVLLYQPQFY